MLKQRWQPSLRFVAPWHDHPAYIQALTASIRAAFNNTRPDALLMSFHGIPQLVISPKATLTIATL